MGKGCGGRAVKGAAAVKVEAPETPPLSPAAVKSSKGKYAPKSHDINAIAVKAEISNFETPKLSKRKPSVKSVFLFTFLAHHVSLSSLPFNFLFLGMSYLIFRVFFFSKARRIYQLLILYMS